jgi:hypothetical protein
MRTLHVSVTQKDLERGVPGNPLRCPVARALDRLVDAEGFPHTFVYVGRHGVWLTGGGGPTWLGWLPVDVRTAIRVYDEGWPQESSPFEFDLELHQPGTVVPDPAGLCPDMSDLLRLVRRWSCRGRQYPGSW